ncbi:hypothetical protein Cus16_0318 [Curtobacterium sp. ER1/6]|nr:hypothetical protein Cus16_0318 [Curtobacterium sp. ER1/6]
MFADQYRDLPDHRARRTQATEQGGRGDGPGHLVPDTADADRPVGVDDPLRPVTRLAEVVQQCREHHDDTSVTGGPGRPAGPGCCVGSEAAVHVHGPLRVPGGVLRNVADRGQLRQVPFPVRRVQDVERGGQVVPLGEAPDLGPEPLVRDRVPPVAQSPREPDGVGVHREAVPRDEPDDAEHPQRVVAERVGRVPEHPVPRVVDPVVGVEEDTSCGIPGDGVDGQVAVPGGDRDGAVEGRVVDDRPGDDRDVEVRRVQQHLAHRELRADGHDDGAGTPERVDHHLRARSAVQFDVDVGSGGRGEGDTRLPQQGIPHGAADDDRASDGRQDLEHAQGGRRQTEHVGGGGAAVHRVVATRAAAGAGGGVVHAGPSSGTSVLAHRGGQSAAPGARARPVDGREARCQPAPRLPSVRW